MLVELSKIKKPKDEKYTATVLDFNSPRTIEAMLMLGMIQLLGFIGIEK